MTGLRFDEVTVRYGDVVALDRVTLEVTKGETVAVVGPSGSGKSTLLRAAAGLEPLAGGRIEADGRDLGPVPVHQRDLGLMFQDHALFPHLDVGANVAFGLRMKGRTGAERDRRVDELLELVGLAGYGSRAVHQLSGGEAQRVALARALAPEPGLLMLDEPFGSLDRVLRDELTDELRRLLDALGQTALHVTHDQAEAFALADRVAVFRDGRLVQFAPPVELWGRPETSFVARFVGRVNVWTVEVDGAGEVRWRGVPVGSREDLAPGSYDVVLPSSAVRPADQGSVEAVVYGCRFHEGGYRVTAIRGEATSESEPDNGEPGGPEPTEVAGFDWPSRLIVGDRIRLEVAIADAVVLGGGERS